VISAKLKNVILARLGLDDWDLQDDTRAGDVPGWDSLSHAAIIAAVEAEYGVRFKTREIIQLANVGQLQRLLDAKVP
jgi:acyl carrier protein